MKIAIVAGEASGDLLGAKLMQTLRLSHPHAEFYGLGGPAMIAAGFRSSFDIERLNVMGLIEPLMRLPDLFKLRRDLYQLFIRNRPDIFIGIDSPDFNIGLELKLRKASIPTVHYVSPSVWAWRQNRIHKIKKAVDLMLTLFPFEAKFYEQHQVPVHYVGHPLAEQIPLEINKKIARRELGLDEDATYVALLPGSRRQEIRYLAEPFLRAAQLAHQQKPDLRFITSHVNEKRHQEFFECYKKNTPNLPIEFFTRKSHEVIAAADVVVVTSGTATLETMLHKKPMIIAYRMSPFAFQIAKWLVKVPFIGLPNLLANESLVPELIQHEANPEAIAEHLLDYLNHPQKMNIIINKFIKLHESLCVDANFASHAILNTINKNDELNLKRV